ncbi:YHS domain-containing (seleno)protein [Yoonia sp. 2307UL14-13]|uniref:YHS domain-containing (seleno)protein n=1 Tax=Yoonia sp. 2307UL14-13 TaxID=3126506 RepID=UPI0030AE5CC8
MHHNRRQILAISVTLPFAAMAGRLAHAQSTPTIYAEGGIAIDGTDPVAYFTESAPVAGDPSITHDWNGATWRFANAENRDTFAADPEAYAPQYGGYCAWAVSEGYTASTVPEAWKIVDGRLYLNFSRRIQRRWERDIPGRIASADANWPDVLNA